MSSPSSSKRHPKQDQQFHIHTLAPHSRSTLAPSTTTTSTDSAGHSLLASPLSPPKKRKMETNSLAMPVMTSVTDMGPAIPAQDASLTQSPSAAPAQKKSRTNTPWTPAEEKRLKTMRDAGSTWSEIAKTFPNRTEGSVKKHWYKDMHYADFAEDESAALLQAIKDYDANKWKVIGQKVGKPAKACEQYAKENFAGRI